MNVKPDYRKIAVGIDVDKNVYTFDAVTGEKAELTFVPKLSERPVDFNGDGIHEFIEENGVDLKDENGKFLCRLGGKLMQNLDARKLEDFLVKSL